MLHNLVHVELNAIDLAWDTVARFAPLRDMLGDKFFVNFARVADDESRHFAWCSQRSCRARIQYIGELGASFEEYRNDELTVEDVKRCTSRFWDIITNCFRTWTINPLFGVCMGLQCIGEAFGG
uniref:Uncharacterized protein n=1 Tax=Ananas comosus var. bracteatus TaxID=296719 RepID=A0A6V7PSN9_ANACO|nr:unnamed protein product [Ananas comosus var. bracteatus]